MKDELSRWRVAKNLPANAGDTRDVGSILRSGRSSGVGNDNRLQYSCLENSMDRGAWRAIVQEFANSWIQRSSSSAAKDEYIEVGAFAKRNSGCRVLMRKDITQAEMICTCKGAVVGRDTDLWKTE